MACSCSQLRLTFLQFVVTMFRFEYVYSYAPARPPRVSVTTFTSYICCIYALKFGQYWTSFCLGNSSVSNTPYIQFLFVRPRLCRGLPSDSTSRWTPLPLANSSYCQVCSGLSPPSDSACRAHQKQQPRRGNSLPRRFCLLSVGADSCQACSACISSINPNLKFNRQKKDASVWETSFLLCARHALSLGGESPLQTWQ